MLYWIKDRYWIHSAQVFCQFDENHLFLTHGNEDRNYILLCHFEKMDRQISMTQTRISLRYYEMQIPLG
jgi:hypothetical protein